MKIKLTLIIILSFISLVKAQEKNGEIALSKNVVLEWKTEKFIPEKHKIETCKTEFGDKYICKIDGELWLGSDNGMENPRNQLTKLSLKINSQSIKLDVSNIFNASFDGELSNRRFSFKKEGEFYRLYSFFSDGAGAYTVIWKVLDNRSIREVISNDERYFDWQKKK